jgi:hypothetical protein
MAIVKLSNRSMGANKNQAHKYQTAKPSICYQDKLIQAYKSPILARVGSEPGAEPNKIQRPRYRKKKLMATMDI